MSIEQPLRCLINTWLRNYWNNVSCRHFGLQQCWLSAPPTLVRPGKHLDILHRTVQLLFPTSLLVQQKVWETSFVIQDIQTSSPLLKARYCQVSAFVWVQIIHDYFSGAEGLLSVSIRSAYTGSAIDFTEVRGRDKHCTLLSVSHPNELVKQLVQNLLLLFPAFQMYMEVPLIRDLDSPSASTAKSRGLSFDPFGRCWSHLYTTLGHCFSFLLTHQSTKRSFCLAQPRPRWKGESTCWIRATALCFSFMGSVKWH